jgi:hypothetical protein
VPSAVISAAVAALAVPVIGTATVAALADPLGISSGVRPTNIAGNTFRAIFDIFFNIVISPVTLLLILKLMYFKRCYLL